MSRASKSRCQLDLSFQEMNDNGVIYVLFSDNKTAETLEAIETLERLVWILDQRNRDLFKLRVALHTEVYIDTYIYFIYPRNLPRCCIANIFEKISYRKKEKSKIKIPLFT